MKNIAELKETFLREHKPRVIVDDDGKTTVEIDQFAFINHVLAELFKRSEDVAQALTPALLELPKKLELLENRVKWLEEQEAKNRVKQPTHDESGAVGHPRKEGGRARV